jgi:hypothetical protein
MNSPGAGFSLFLNCANAQNETETNQESEVVGTTYLEKKILSGA